MRLFLEILGLFDTAVGCMLRVELLRLLLCVGALGIVAGLALRIKKMTV